MIDPAKFVVGPDATIEDIDLDVDEVYFRGERLTNEGAEALAEETLAEIRKRNLVPGRKSLSGGTTHSPRVQFRVPDEIREQAEKRAREQGVSLSVLAREALVRYLAS
jgi:predicted HicB family RNase H-like nuclease